MPGAAAPSAAPPMAAAAVPAPVVEPHAGGSSELPVGPGSCAADGRRLTLGEPQPLLLPAPAAAASRLGSRERLAAAWPWPWPLPAAAAAPVPAPPVSWLVVEVVVLLHWRAMACAEGVLPASAEWTDLGLSSVSE